MNDFLNDFLNGFKNAYPSKKEAINKYIRGEWTKKQLDEYMEKYNDR